MNYLYILARAILFLSFTCLAFFFSFSNKSLAVSYNEYQLQNQTVEDNSQDIYDSLAPVTPKSKTPTPPGQATIEQPTTPPPAGTAKPESKPESPPPAAPEREAQPSPDLLASTYDARGEYLFSQRLAGTPNMFGDLFTDMGSHLIATKAGVIGEVDLPLAAACRRVKVAENNNALPQDRIYFMYNYFNNALSSDMYAMIGPVVMDHSDFSLNRYTIGFEKTFLDRRWSVELRMPFAGQWNHGVTNFDFSGGAVGNLAILLKRLIYKSDGAAACIGLGIDTPTGDDAEANFVYYQYTLRNQAVHLLPYAGIVWAPNERRFWQGFVQVDVPTNGNRVDYDNVETGPGALGYLSEQTLLYLDLQTGYWLYRNPDAARLTSLAAVAEVHYTTTLNDAPAVTGLAGQAWFGNPANRVDIVNLTVGLHSEFAGHTLLRVGGVFPLSNGDDRSFESELQVQLERRF
jgi:hypothetical protein